MLTLLPNTDPITFAEQFLFKPENNEPFQSFWVQQQLLAPGTSTSNLHTVRAQRGIGVSTAMQVGLLHYVVTHPCAHAWVIAPYQISLRNFIESLKLMCGPAVLLSMHNPYEIVFDNGSSIRGQYTRDRKGEYRSKCDEFPDYILVLNAEYLLPADWDFFTPLFSPLANDASQPTVWICGMPNENKPSVFAN